MRTQHSSSTPWIWNSSWHGFVDNEAFFKTSWIWTWYDREIASIVYNETADVTIGCMLCLCFLIGTVGNLVSFIYFKSKKRDISNVIYMFITATDIVISVSSLPVGISYLSRRQLGILFGNKYGCVVFYFIWNIAILLSVFLVLCLSAARTISLLRPFLKQKIRYLVIAALTYTILMLTKLASFDSLGTTIVKFDKRYSMCLLIFYVKEPGSPELIAIMVSYNLVYTLPALVVAISCVITVVVLKRSSRNVQQRELQQSRNRATITILLFALIYGICNAPMVVHYIALTFYAVTGNWIHRDFYGFDEHGYYQAVIFSLLPMINSAANPVLYFWRMKPLREYTSAGVRKY